MRFTTPLQQIQIAIATATTQLFKIALVPNQIVVDIAYPKYAADYTCVIALRLTNSLPSLTPFAIAEAIAQHCSQDQDFANKFAISAIGKGWLNISMTPSYRLKTLVSLDYWNPEQQNISDSVDLDDSTYVYARCHALLRLADQACLSPQNLCLNTLDNEPAAIALLLQNLAIADYLQNPNIQTLQLTHKLRRSLVTTFLDFYRQCRIFGVNEDLVQTRIYLIRITQKLILAIAPPHVTYKSYL